MSLNQNTAASSAVATSLERIKTLPVELNERLLKRLNKSVVFADPQFMEWFTLTIGVETLLRQAGAHNVKEFSEFENGEEHAKAVFLIAQPIKDVVLGTLKEIIIASQFQFIIIITSIDPNSYDESGTLFDQLNDQCLNWMSNPNYTCELFYEKFPFAIFPQHSSSIPTENSALLFLNPFANWSESSTDYLDQIVSIDVYQRLVKQEASDAAGSSGAAVNAGKDHYQQILQGFGQHELNQLKAISYSINEMIDLLDAKVDCFTMGILSTLVANEINNNIRKKNSSNKVSLLLIDRNLDLSMASLFQEETVFDKISNLLPNFCSSSNDVRLDLGHLFFENKFKSMVPGSFFHFSSEACRTLVELFFQSKPKECAIEVFRKLSEVCPMNELGKEKKASRISSDLLKSQIRTSFKNNSKSAFENIDLVQIVAAYCQITDSQSSRTLEFEKLASFVKVLTQNILNKDGPSVLSRLYGMFSEKIAAVERNEKLATYSISDLVVLLIYVYSLIGEECYYGVEEEQRIKKLLINEFQSESFQKDARFKSDLEFFKKIKNNMNIAQFVEKFFQNLKQLKYIRRNMKHYSKLLIHDEEKDQYTYKPLIRQVCENIVNTMGSTTEPLADIEHRTSSQSEGFNLFRGFKIGSYLMNTSSVKPHPMNNELLIIYFVGGVTSYEFKLVKDVLKEQTPGRNILIGSSHFCNHTKLIKYLLS